MLKTSICLPLYCSLSLTQSNTVRIEEQGNRPRQQEMPPFAAVVLHLICFLLQHSSAAHLRQQRRILHQPLFPEDPPPPIPKYPFSSSPPDNTPFLPINPSPPAPVPPRPASYSSFPAKIPSLIIPHSKSKSASSKLITAAVAAAIAAVAVVTIAVCVHLHRRRRSGRAPVAKEEKTQRSDSSSADNASRRPPNVQLIPKLQRPSQTSSEFLYLGTLVNSHPGGGGIDFSGSISRVNDDTQSLATESPELHPLPPLNPQQSLRRNYRNNADAKSSKDDQDEQFYSPRRSLGVESSIATGSASRRAFSTIPVENFNGSPSNSSSIYSSTASGSCSGSPARSGSLSLTPENSLSPRNSMPKSPDLIEIRNIAPPHRQITRPQGIASKESASSSPPSSSSPGGYSRSSIESSPRVSSCSDQNTESPVRISYLPDANPTVSLPPRPKIIPSPPTLTVPPPPPPLPAAVKISESPKTPSLPSKKPVPDPPALIAPLRGIAVEKPRLISPIELPKKDFQAVKEHLGEAPEPDEETTPKPKLKPLHWDKVRASSDREMVWDQLKSSSFKLNEEMIETLFVANAPKPTPKEQTRWQVLPSPVQDSGDRVLDPKKAQNISILFRALNVTVEEVCEGLLEGNTDTLGTELLESLLKMAPTKEEERKLKEYKDASPSSLGIAERFLKAALDIPYAFKRVETMLYVANFESEVEYLRKSFATLENACEELRTSRMFLKILEAVLKTGNRMNVGTNRGDAHAFKLDTLLKLVDVKGADGKTTLLHFVIHEIIRSEGARLSESPTVSNDAKCKKLGLKVVSGLSSELLNVKKAATMDAEVLNSDLAKLFKGNGKIQEVVRLIKEMSLDYAFCDSMYSFMQKAEEDIIRIQAQESVALSLVKEITEYFHGNSAKEEAHPFRIFMVVRDFLTNLDRVCKEVGIINKHSSHKIPVPVNPMLQQVSVDFLSKRQQHSSSGEDSS